MDVSVTTTEFRGRVRAVASKSMAHRYFICAALADEPTHIVCEEFSKDMDATLNCLVTLGAQAYADSEGFTIYPARAEGKKDELQEKLPGSDGGALKMDCGESGSTLRFLLPVIGALGVSAKLTLRGRLAQRPLSPLYEQMIEHGCELSNQGESPLCCTGQLTGGSYELAGNISSQYISGLLFALPLLEADSVLRVTGKLESAGYVDMTLDTIREFGIAIDEEDVNGARLYHIKGRQKYHSPGMVQVEGDWSNAAFWLCAGAIKGSVTCTNLNPYSRQGDRKIVAILESFGARITEEGNNAFTVECKELHGIELDAADVPDLVPAVSAVAALAKGKTVIKNASRLRLKESDRLEAVSRSLSALGANIVETHDGLIIEGKQRLDGGRASSCGDHRIAMMEAVAAAGCDGAVVIEDAEAVDKSYPAFYCDFISLGGSVRGMEQESI